MKRNILLISLIVLIHTACQNLTHTAEDIRIYEESITIPTYLISDPEKNPVFYTPRQYQGAQLRIYPYENLNKLTEERVDKEYKGLFIENEYIKICVLPELGGRLYSAIDKTNGYDFIYRNHVIKPALIGMAGAWISGGVEWNIPHHHRVSTFMPVDYRLIENPDGSKTIWVGEFEKRHQSRWIVGLTVYPGKSYIQTDIRLFNTTPYEQSFLAWANTAVHANEDYQVIFPPDVERAVFHSKVEFIDFPVADQYYRGIDFRGDVDVSWWKNTTSPTSFFAWDTEMDFLGGIDHGENAGIILVGDHRTFIGKKFWNWGDNEVGRLWDQMLTDEDGPYLELMMGMYSDNQPDYNWNDPMDARTGTMYFMPLRNLHSIKNANKNLAVNLEQVSDSLLIQVYSTGKLKDARIELSDNMEVIFTGKADLTPDRSFQAKIAADKTTDLERYELRILSSGGDKLISYRSPVHEDLPVPPVYHNPPEPGEISSNDDLLLTALRIEQFGNPRFNPLKYYFEGLDRDPDDFLQNTQLGVHYLKLGDPSKAEILFRKAVEKVTGNYTTPKYAEPLYYLGISLFEQKNYEEAIKWLNKASWHRNWKSPSMYYMALINANNGDYFQAIELSKAAVSEDNDNIDALCLLSALYRSGGEYKKAEEILVQVLESDPLNQWAVYESALLMNLTNVSSEIDRAGKSINTVFRDEPDNYLTVAQRYGQAGMFQEGLTLLIRALDHSDVQKGNYPLLQYYLAWIFMQQEDVINSERYYTEVKEMVKINCFPYGTFTERVLTDVLTKYPEDAALHYYLGNLYADGQPDKAIEHWQKAIEINDTLAVARRNIAFIQANIFNQVDEAIANIENAIKINSEDPIYLTEADQYYAYKRYKPDKRLEKLNAHIRTAKKADRSDLRRIKLNTFMGNFDESIRSLNERHFHIEEITDINPHEEWTDAHLVKGIDLLNKGDYEMAIETFKKIFEFPRNLEIPRDSRTGMAWYWLGRTYEEMGDKQQAEENYQNMIEFEAKEGWGGGRLPILQFYTALSLKKLGRNQEAGSLLNDLIEDGKKNLNYRPHRGLDMRSVKVRQDINEQSPQGNFMIGMGLLGSGMNNSAKVQFQKALEGKPDHLDAFLLQKEEILRFL